MRGDTQFNVEDEKNICRSVNLSSSDTAGSAPATGTEVKALKTSTNPSVDIEERKIIATADEDQPSAVSAVAVAVDRNNTLSDNSVSVEEQMDDALQTIMHASDDRAPGVAAGANDSAGGDGARANQRRFFSSIPLDDIKFGTSAGAVRVTELSPPVPFVVPECEEDDCVIHSKIARHSDRAAVTTPISARGDCDDIEFGASAGAVTEPSPSVSFVVPKFEDNDFVGNDSVRRSEIARHSDRAAAAAPSTARDDLRWEKSRTLSAFSDPNSAKVGATQVGEQAPQINRRFFRGLDRASAILHNARARRERAAHRRRQAAAEEDDGEGQRRGEAADADGGGEERSQQISMTGRMQASVTRTSTGEEPQDEQQVLGESSVGRRRTLFQRMMTTMFANVTAADQTRRGSIEEIRRTSWGEYLISATLVEPNEVEAGEVVVAERLGFFERKSKSVASAMCFLLVLMAVFIYLSLTQEVEGGPPEEGTGDRSPCDPCIIRKSYTIKAILHGLSGGVYNKFFTSARQLEKDMGVNLDLNIYPREELSNELMVADIRAVVEPGAGVDALIVDVSSKAVATAVRYVAEMGMPVFGVNSGSEFALGPEGLVYDESMLFFAAMDERLAGEKAASYFLRQFSSTDGKGSANLFEKYTDALFVAPAGAKNSAHAQHFEGYRNRLTNVTNNTINVEWFEVDSSASAGLLIDKLSGCTYQSVLVGELDLMMKIARAKMESQCDWTKIGLFGTNPEMEIQIAEGILDFAIEQIYDLHGWSSVQFATLYVTTGLVLAPPPAGAYLSSPALLTKDNITKKLLSICNDNEDETDGTDVSSSERECIDRKNIAIGGVVHGTTASKFWGIIFSAAEQSAIDMGVQLMFDRFEPQENDKELYEMMVSKILGLCERGIDGLFVTLTDDLIADAVMKCQEFNPGVKIMSINAGFGKSKELNLIHHIGMTEEDAGYEAGKMMVKMATFKKALCCNHKPWLNVLNERCTGFERAMNEMGIEYLGQVEVTEDDISSSMSAVERVVGLSGDWDDHGTLLAGLSPLPVALELRKLHRNFIIGSFDTNSLLYEALDTGDVLFGIDQQPYLQGYLPVSILTHVVTTKQSFVDHSIQSGPRFIIAPPTDEMAECKDQNFPVCPMEGQQLGLM